MVTCFLNFFSFCSSCNVLFDVLEASKCHRESVTYYLSSICQILEFQRVLILYGFSDSGLL